MLEIGAGITGDTPTKRIHDLRIECKKLRYLIEVFRSLYPPEAIEEVVRSLKRLQNTLGDFNDFQVHADMLRRFAPEVAARENGADDPTPAMERLTSQLIRRRERQRAKFFRRFQSFARSEATRGYRELFAAASAGG